jgi:biofilm PGA synthesis N-glycosyltransferase PgaC
MGVIIGMFLLAFVLLALIVLIYAAFMFWCASRFKPQVSSEPINPYTEGVSVIIPFRNEALYLENCLVAFVQQNKVSFPFEILLINDGSEDQSETVLAQFENRLPLKLLHSNGIGKKAALQTGIDAAKYNIIYTIDADCVVKPNTLAYMGNTFQAENLNMLCGLVNLTPAKGLFQNLQAAESAALVGISAVMLNSSKPATCNGANLMFRKDVFFKLKGYENYKHLSSGDDDFLMHAFFNFNASACQYAIHPDGVVETAPEQNLSNFFNQRARWASKRKHYIFPYNKYLFALMGLKFLTYWALLFFMVINCFYWGSSTPWILFLLLYVSELAFAKRLGEVLKLNYLSILCMPLYQFYLPMVLMYGKFFKIKWKGRHLRAQ